jgi:ribonuclease HI
MNTKYSIWFDGSCLPTNPSYETIGAFVVRNEKNERVFDGRRHEKHMILTSNNYAEYCGLILALEWLSENPFKEALIFGDSLLVIKQMRGAWKIKNGMYLEAARYAQKLLFNLQNVKLDWVPREQNLEADRLTQRRNH